MITELQPHAAGSSAPLLAIQRTLTQLQHPNLICLRIVCLPTAMAIYMYRSDSIASAQSSPFLANARGRESFVIADHRIVSTTVPAVHAL